MNNSSTPGHLPEQHPANRPNGHSLAPNKQSPAQPVSPFQPVDRPVQTAPQSISRPNSFFPDQPPQIKRAELQPQQQRPSPPKPQPVRQQQRPSQPNARS